MLQQLDFDTHTYSVMQHIQIVYTTVVYILIWLVLLVELQSEEKFSAQVEDLLCIWWSFICIENIILVFFSKPSCKCSIWGKLCQHDPLFNFMVTREISSKEVFKTTVASCTYLSHEIYIFLRK